MKHRLSAIVQLSSPNSGKFYRSVSVNDFYWGEPGFEFPMGHIQNTGGLLQDITFAESPPFFRVWRKQCQGLTESNGIAIAGLVGAD